LFGVERRPDPTAPRSVRHATIGIRSPQHFLQLDAAGKEVFHFRMKKILFWLFVIVSVASAIGMARAQDTATQQQIDKLSGQIQDLLDAQSLQDKRISALDKKIADLQEKLNKPAAAGDIASADELKKLAAQVYELSKKQQADNDLILKELEKLSKAGGGSTSSRRSSGNTENTSSSVTTNSTSTTNNPQKGYYYEVKSGDTPSAIAKAYRSQGIKVTADEILAANPGLKPNNLVVGKKIFIPDANAK
jgi:LysM repeat protein